MGLLWLFWEPNVACSEGRIYPFLAAEFGRVRTAAVTVRTWMQTTDTPPARSAVHSALEGTMRPLVATLLAALAAPLLLVACSGDQASPTAPDMAPATALSASRSVPLDPSHTYRFGFACSAAAPNSIVHITNDGNIGSINVPCNSSTELGMAYGSTFSNFGFEVTLDSPAGVKVCSQAGVTRTGTFKCRSQKYLATLTVTDEGVLPTF